MLICASCGASEGIERHHLLPCVYGGAEGPTVPLCGDCHGMAHGIRRPKNLGALISAGIKAAQARGIKIGGRKGKRPSNPGLFINAPELSKKGLAVISQRADARAENLCRLLNTAQASGAQTSADQAAWLNQFGHVAARGGLWTEANVKVARRRYAARLAT